MDHGEHAVLLGFAVLLATIGIVAFPRWRHSRAWGYMPSAMAGILLLAVATVAAVGRPATATAIRITKAPPAPATSLHNPTIDNARERLSWAREPSIAALSTPTDFD
jgi:hypothetical protein